MLEGMIICRQACGVRLSSCVAPLSVTHVVHMNFHNVVIM